MGKSDAASRVGEKHALELTSIVKAFGLTTAVTNFSLSIKNGEFISLLGPSGCGKTTVLRCIAGYVQPDQGTIVLNGRDVTFMPPYRRDIGMVFQNYALFPHMTIAQNIGFGLRMRHVPDKELRERVEDALALVHLSDLGNRRPHELSGGQQQRVALARAIVIRPSLLLLDEPLSNLDAKLRKNMQIEIRRLQEATKITTLHVTHDQAEALSLSDRIVVMNQGHIEQLGNPNDIYEAPRTAFVADFIGESNLLAGQIQSPNPDGHTAVTLSTGETLHVDRAANQTDTLVDVLIRPEHIQILSISAPAPSENAWSATIERVVYSGPSQTILLVLDSGLKISAEPRGELSEAFKTSARVRAYLPRQFVRLLPR